MAWSAPRTWTQGEVVVPSYLNTNVRDDIGQSFAAKFTTAGDIGYATGANAAERLAIGTAGYLLEVNAGATAPQWRYPPDLWWVEIEPLSRGATNTGWSTSTVDASALYRGYLASSGAQNDEVTFPVQLAAGTWTCRVVYEKNTDAGVFSIQLDGSEVGTVDAYAAAQTRNQRSDVTGISVATSGKKTFKLKMATKNASSSSYVGRIQHATWFRTA